MKKRLLFAACAAAAWITMPCMASGISLGAFEELYVSRLVEYEIKYYGSIQAPFGAWNYAPEKTAFNQKDYYVVQTSAGTAYVNTEDLSVEMLTMMLYDESKTDNTDNLVSCIASFSVFEYPDRYPSLDGTPMEKAYATFTEIIDGITIDQVKDSDGITAYTGKDYYYYMYYTETERKNYVSIFAIAKDSTMSLFF